MNMDFVRRYAPIILFDEKEPFFPLRVGYTIFDKPGRSSSFPRNIQFYDHQVEYVIEYAIYWDFDIQHLYELEHVWVFVGKGGEIYECEASFHGKYLRGLKKDRSNIENGTHVILYSQPGKHAFSPITELFDLLPQVEKSTCENAGIGGLDITGVAKSRYETNEEINQMVKNYLRKYSFRPSMQFRRYEIPPEIFIPWEKLDREIPERIHAKLDEIRNELL